MNCDEVLDAYLDETEQPDSKIALQIEQHLEHCDACRTKIREMKLLLSGIQHQPRIEPPAEIKLRFDDYLQNQIVYHSKTTVVRKLSRQIWLAASLVLLVGLAILYVVITQRSEQKSQAQVASMEGDSSKAFTSLSTSARIQAINESNYQQQNPELFKALSNILLRDRNANVRMAALYCLADHINDPAVYSLFIEALKTEQDPVLQVLLINTIAKKKSPKSVEAIQSLINNSATRTEVRSVAEQTIKTL
jgi:hypothetical protein